MATKKTTVKKPLKKAQTGGYTSPYGGTGANKPKSNKSAMIAGVIGSAVSAAAAAIAKRKKSPQALVDQYMQKADKAKAKGKEERYKRFTKKAALESNKIDQTNANVERKFSEENLNDQKKYGGTMKKGGNWIQGAIKKPGSLTATAKKAGKVNKEGKINKSWLREKAQGSGVTAKRARLAITLGKLRKNN